MMFLYTLVVVIGNPSGRINDGVTQIKVVFKI
jgi:hypothetical protein